MIEELKEEEIVNKVGGRFKLSTLIQKRMIALNQGARPLVDGRGRRQDDDGDPGDHAGQDLPRHVRQAPDQRADRGDGGRRRNRRSYPVDRMSKARPAIPASRAARPARPPAAPADRVEGDATLRAPAGSGRAGVARAPSAPAHRGDSMLVRQRLLALGAGSDLPAR